MRPFAFRFGLLFEVGFELLLHRQGTLDVLPAIFVGSIVAEASALMHSAMTVALLNSDLYGQQYDYVIVVHVLCCRAHLLCVAVI
jgi:hypothetical protein